VRYRIGESLREAMRLPEQIGVQLTERFKSLAKLLPTSKTLQEGRFKFDKDGEMHILSMSQRSQLQAASAFMLRIARESAGVHGFSLSALGLHGDNLEKTHALLQHQPGLVLVAGPQGGGKTTTLYTLLDQLDHHQLSIATVEDRVEHRFPHAAQTQTRPELGLTTVAGLRAVS
jgi:type IV pilus assembly protein PilB